MVNIVDFFFLALEMVTIVDFFTLPPLFLSVWLSRTWIGLRCHDKN
jgi:hypothetical protein